MMNCLPSIRTSRFRYVFYICQRKLNQLQIENQETFSKQKLHRTIAIKIKEITNCSKDEALRLSHNEEILKLPFENVVRNIELLDKKNIKMETIMDNLWLLKLSSSNYYLVFLNNLH